MLNIMIMEGYVRTEPEVIKNPKDESKYLVKFQLATLNGFDKEKNGKYIWLNVVAFSGMDQVEYLKKSIHKDDYISCVGSFSYMSSGNKYYVQMVLQHIDKKWSKGQVPSVETIDQDDNPNDKKEMNW